jgi:hypothetical protein
MGKANKWEPPGMIMVRWDNGMDIPMYYHELERVDSWSVKQKKARAEREKAEREPELF